MEYFLKASGLVFVVLNLPISAIFLSFGTIPYINGSLVLVGLVFLTAGYLEDK